LTETSTIIALYLLIVGLTLAVLGLLERLSVARRKLAEMTAERDHLRDRPKYPTHPTISREHADESNNPL
jgi:hypothetical protein